LEYPHRIIGYPEVFIHVNEHLHVFLRNFKIENIEVLFYPFLVGRFRNGGYVQLKVPSKDDLGWGFAVFGVELLNAEVIDFFPLSSGVYDSSTIPFFLDGASSSSRESQGLKTFVG
jgi:hypothetical protein